VASLTLAHMIEFLAADYPQNRHSTTNATANTSDLASGITFEFNRS
jgi:hypothetical protein